MSYESFYMTPETPVYFMNVNLRSPAAWQKEVRSQVDDIVCSNPTAPEDVVSREGKRRTNRLVERRQLQLEDSDGTDLAKVGGFVGGAVPVLGRYAPRGVASVMESYNANRFGIPKGERDSDFKQKMRAASQTDGKALKKEAGRLTEKGIKSGLKGIGEGATSWLSTHVPMANDVIQAGSTKAHVLGHGNPLAHVGVAAMTGYAGARNTSKKLATQRDICMDKAKEVHEKTARTRVREIFSKQSKK